MPLDPLLRFLHLTSVTVWVGGMFFAYLCLRPVAVELFEPPQRLRMWQQVFARFFYWVWIAVMLIPISGLIMLGRAGFLAAPLHWYLMMGSGLVMIAIFIHVVTGPYHMLKRAVAVENWQAGGTALGRIRRLVGLNLSLGMVTIALATLGRLLT
ncbi:CopD family protein [Chitinivorax sp. B]|uniref:CopD family protein n=1 Tax=Chitinivorax sp. B TaxID=2502235 RepID=UPI0010F963C1|nr:CopD family protein [Chitinivorax sp. B]